MRLQSSLREKCYKISLLFNILMVELARRTAAVRCGAGTRTYFLLPPPVNRNRLPHTII